jgi:hypothetical protein
MVPVLLGLGLLLTGPGYTKGDYFLITNRADLSGDDAVDWGILGYSSNTLVPNPFSISSANGLVLTVCEPNGSFRYFEQSPTPGAGYPPFWVGNFAPNDHLMNTDVGNPGPINISFSALIHGAGAQIQTNNGGDFVARISAFDADGNLLASFTEPGQSNSQADNTAIFKEEAVRRLQPTSLP